MNYATLPNKPGKTLLHDTCSEDTLQRAWKLVQLAGGAAGTDGQTIEQFASQAAKELADLRGKLARDLYRFSRLRSAAIPKSNGSQRFLGIPTVRDRVVLQALRLVIEPACERAMLDCSHAYRPGRGAMTALESIARGMNAGMRFVLETDIRGFFDSIRHKPLLAQLHTLDPRTKGCRLIAGALAMSSGWWSARKGVAQGSPLSPLLANVALLDFDRCVSSGPWRLVRYADDLVLLCRSAADAQAGFGAVKKELRKIGLEIHPDKTCIVDSQKEAFTFVGFEFRPDRISPTAENLARFRDGIIAWCNPHCKNSWMERIDRINALVRSFAWYYHQTDSTRLFWTLDQFVLEQLEELEVAIGIPETPWRECLVKMSQMREIGWVGVGRKRKTKGWNGYGR